MSQQDESNKSQGADGRCPNADPKAIATAMTVRDAAHAAHAATVILHGSRARGDHRDRSDVNLILIHHRAPDQRIADAATATGDSEARRHYGTDDSGACPVEVSISWALPGDVQRGRNTINGIFARALDEGIAINRNWWETNYHRLEATHPSLYEPQITAKLLSECALELMLASIQGQPPATAAQRQAHHGSLALKRALEAWISSAGVRFPWKATAYRLMTLAQENGAQMRDAPTEEEIEMWSAAARAAAVTGDETRLDEQGIRAMTAARELHNQAAERLPEWMRPNQA